MVDLPQGGSIIFPGKFFIGSKGNSKKFLREFSTRKSTFSERVIFEMVHLS